MILKVLKPFFDKYNPEVQYLAGYTIEVNEVARINDMVARGLAVLVEDTEADTSAEIPTDTPDAEDSTKEAVPTVTFEQQSYPVATLKVALEAIGITLSKSAGVPAVTKKLAELTEEQLTALHEVLASNE